MAATYTKLKTGEWGIRVVGYCPSSGGTIEVHKRDGTTKTERIKKVVWSGKDAKTGENISLCEVESARTVARAMTAGASRGRGTRTGCRCGSVEEYTKPTDCWNCKHDAE